jgi:hypothetical protein
MSRERRTIPVVPQGSGAVLDCPLAPPAHATVFARTLHRACLVLGGVQALAQQLEAPEQQIREWLTGAAEIPQPVFIAAVEIVLLHASGGPRAS